MYIHHNLGTQSLTKPSYVQKKTATCKAYKLKNIADLYDCIFVLKTFPCQYNFIISFVKLLRELIDRRP